jgi:hypothetical protein
MFINDIVHQITSCRVHLYADDVQIYTNCKPVVSMDLDWIHQWSIENCLAIKTEKSQALLANPSILPSPIVSPFLFGSNHIAFVDKVKNLGIIFNQELTRICCSNFQCLKGFAYSKLFFTLTLFSYIFVIFHLIYQFVPSILIFSFLLEYVFFGIFFILSYFLCILSFFLFSFLSPHLFFPFFVFSFLLFSFFLYLASTGIPSFFNVLLQSIFSSV